MKIILLKDVAKLGQKGEVKEVSDGHALNFLIPKKLAQFADEKSIKEAEKQMEASAQEREQRQEKVLQTASELKKKGLKIKAKVNEKGSLFAGLNEKDIAEKAQALDFELSEEFLKLDKPIKEVGSFNVSVVAGDKEIVFELTVEAEE